MADPTKSPGDLLALLVAECELHDAIADMAPGNPLIEQMRASLPEVDAKIDAAFRRYGFTDPAEAKTWLQLPVLRMFRARQAAFEQIVQLARKDELDKHK